MSPTNHGLRVPPPEEEKLSFVIPSDLNQGRQVQDAILDACRRKGFGEDAYFAVKLALDEAVTNAIKHGNKLDPAKSVAVKATVTADRVDLEIRDEGPGFDPNRVPDPTLDENLGKCSGRGLLLIEAYMSDVDWSKDGRTIFMSKANRSEQPSLPKTG
ncbi:MAG: ATP-binding protein [Planctomycetota bacterium]